MFYVLFLTFNFIFLIYLFKYGNDQESKYLKNVSQKCSIINMWLNFFFFFEETPINKWTFLNVNLTY